MKTRIVSALAIVLVMSIALPGYADICASINMHDSFFHKFHKSAEYLLKNFAGELNIDYEQGNKPHNIRLDLPKEAGISQRCTLAKKKLFGSDKPLSNVRIFAMITSSKFVRRESSGDFVTKTILEETKEPRRLDCAPKKIKGPIFTKTLNIDFESNADGDSICRFTAVVKQ